MLYSLQYDESEKRREMAKNSLERYTHYYERWATNQSVWSILSLNLYFMLSDGLYDNKTPSDLFIIVELESVPSYLV